MSVIMDWRDSCTHPEATGLAHARDMRVDGFPFSSQIAVPLWLGVHKLTEFSVQNYAVPKHYFHRKRDHLWIALGMQPQEKQDEEIFQSEG